MSTMHFPKKPAIATPEVACGRRVITTMTLISFLFPSGNRHQSFGYNELGVCNYENSGGLRISHMNFDVFGHLSENYERTGLLTSYVNSRQGIPTYILYPDGTFMLNTVDFNGVVQSHQDLSGDIYNNTYDYKKQLIARHGLGSSGHGDDIDIRYYTLQTSEGPIWKLSLQPHPVKAQNMAWRYVAGRMMEETDHAQLKQTVYGYDKNGKAILRKLYSNNNLVRTIHSYLDALGREVMTSDDNLTLWTGYDLANNWMKIVTALYEGYNRFTIQERWSLFDAVDNVVIDGGSLVNHQIVIGDGIAYGYLTGLRVAEQKGNVGTALGYDADGLLTAMVRGGKGITRTYNPAIEIERIDNSDDEHYAFVRNDNGWMTEEDYHKGDEIYSKITYPAFANLGLVLKQKTRNAVYKDGDLDTVVEDNTDYNYVHWDSAKTAFVIGGRTVVIHDDETKQSPYQASAAFHDANGTTTAIVGQQDPDDPKIESPILTALTSTSGGLMLGKQVYYNYSSPLNVQLGPQVLNFLTVDDHLLGTYTPVDRLSPNFWQYLQQGVTDFGGMMTGVESVKIFSTKQIFVMCE